MTRGNFYVSLQQSPAQFLKEKFSSSVNSLQNSAIKDPPNSSANDPLSNAQSQLQQDRNVYYSIIGTSAGIIALALYQLIISSIYVNRRKESSHG